MSFDINWAAVASQLTPPFLRQPAHMAWVGVQLSPCRTMHNAFLAYVQQARRLLAYNSQVLLLESALNDTFDASRRGIYITHDDTRATSYYIGTEAEYEANGLPEGIFIGKATDSAPPAYFFAGTAAEYIQPVVCVVHVPDDLYFAITTNYTMANKVSAVVNRYKFAGLAHQVVFYTYS